MRKVCLFELQSVRKGSEGGVPAARVCLDRVYQQLHQVHVESGSEVWNVLHLQLDEGAHFGSRRYASRKALACSRNE
jgi:hypothetical protein